MIRLAWYYFSSDDPHGNRFIGEISWTNGKRFMLDLSVVHWRAKNHYASDR